MAEHITYGPGGFDRKADDSNVVDRFEVEDPGLEETPIFERVKLLEERTSDSRPARP